MNLKLSGVGAEPKKLAALGALVLVALYFVFFSGPSNDGPAVAPVHSTGALAVPGLPSPTATATSRARRGQAHSLKEFKPSIHPKDPPPRDKIDPTLHTALLAKLQTVSPVGGRSLFDFGKVEVAQAATVKDVAPIKPAFLPWTVPAPPKPKPPPPPPSAPPIPLKFYGWINPHQTTAPKRAFFLDGEEIVVVTEGEIIKKRYKVVRIGLNSAVVEDTQFKVNNQQTLPLIEEQAG